MWKDIIQKEKYGQESGPFGLFSSYPVISSINKLNKHKAVKNMSTFDFSTLYTKGGTRDYVTVYNSGSF